MKFALAGNLIFCFIINSIFLTFISGVFDRVKDQAENMKYWRNSGMCIYTYYIIYNTTCPPGVSVCIFRLMT